MASPVTQAAIARLGIQVALPSRGDISRGLSWMPGMLEGIFKRINQATYGSAQKAVSDQQSLLRKMQSDEIGGETNRHAFIARAEEEQRSTSLSRFKKHGSEANSIARRAALALKPSSGTGSRNYAMKMGIKNKEIQSDINKVLKNRNTAYQIMNGLSELYYKNDAKYRHEMIQGLGTEHQARLDYMKDLQRRKEQFQIGLAEDPTARKLQASGWDPKSQLASMDRDIMKARHSAEDLGVVLNHFQDLSKAPAQGIRDFNEEFKKQTTIAGKLQVRLEQLDSEYSELAYNITMKVQTAFGNFRDALQQTVLTLTIFYYKLNDTVQGFQQFEKELINAQSIFQTTNETLYTLSNQIVRFGTEFGITYENAASGLYQFASAGLSAEDSIKVLNDTLKLSMAVQGDHNTISKLTTQVIFGFGMEMDQATEVTDKFAHAINKSLIEYQDLASAIKFSMPFFVSSGQSLDTLLGALQILTNRALEAGIAGRGLRQALAEFTQHADDNAAAFRKLGVEILDTEGNMFDLTHIAHQFSAALGTQASDMEVMMTLMDDLNIRGATAFIHLVQNADEFSAAVDDLKNSAGAAHEMAMIQQESLFNQIQILKNALMAPFLLADPAAVARGEMNEFATAIHNVVENLKAMLLVENENGTALTKLGYQIREVAIKGIQEFGKILDRTVKLVLKFTEAGVLNMNLIKLYFLPISVLIFAFEKLNPELFRIGLFLYIINKTLPIVTTLTWAYAAAAYIASGALAIQYIQGHKWAIMGWSLVITNKNLALSFIDLGAAISSAFLGLIVGYKIGQMMADSFGPLATIIMGVAIALAALMIAMSWGASAITTIPALLLTFAAFSGIGIAVAGMSDYAAPSADLSGYEAQLEGSYALGTGAAGTATTETLYVNKLNYTDSNEAVYLQNQSDTQIGAFQ